MSEFFSAGKTYQQLSKFISPYSTKRQSLSDFSVMSVQYQYLSKFVSEIGESQYFSGLVEIGGCKGAFNEAGVGY